eukprot:tig00021127_g18806.t1
MPPSLRTAALVAGFVAILALCGGVLVGSVSLGNGRRVVLDNGAAFRSVASVSAETMAGAMPDIIVGPAGKHSATVIWMHGLGDTGKGWSDTGKMFGSAMPHVKFVYPTAAIRPVTLNMGMSMPAWFDIFGLSDTAREDEEGITATSKRILAMVDKEIEAGIAPNRIVLAGFSQGGAIALYSGLTANKTLGGIVGLSCWLPLSEKFPAAIPDLEGRKGIPILQCHGDMDSVVRTTWGKKTHSALKGLGFGNASWSEFAGMDHSACPEEIDEIRSFLQRILP